MSKRNELTAENLKQDLWETLQGVRRKKIAYQDANAIAGSAREIMRIVRTEIQIAQLGLRMTGFIAGTPRLKKK